MPAIVVDERGKRNGDLPIVPTRLPDAQKGPNGLL